MNPVVRLISIFAALAISSGSFAAEKITPPPCTETAAQRDARMAWWREARFGMFIHYGLYSGLEGEWEGKSIGGGGVEWIQERTGASGAVYRAAAIPKFKPTPTAPAAWAKLAKEAGAKYVVLTSKHHEGFALFDSKLTDYTAAAVLGRDIVNDYAKAVRAEGLKVGYYHSVIDWHHPEYDFRNAKGLPYPSGEAKAAGDKPRDHKKYIEFLHGQVDELISNYGAVDILWWDFSSAQFDGEEAWHSIELMEKVRKKQPNIIFNNRLYNRKIEFINKGLRKLDNRYADFITPEQHIPANGTPGMDWETCMTINDTWGWSKYDKRWKSTKTLVQNLCDIVSKGGNYLLNIGPKPDGSIPDETVDRMRSIGGWLLINGEAIYGTTASPLPSTPPWGRITRKGKMLYLHVFAVPATGTVTVAIANEATSAVTLSEKDKKLAVTKSEKGLEIQTPASSKDGLPVVIALEIVGEPVPLN